MPRHETGVKSPAELASPAGPGAYARWRGTTLGGVTEALEQQRVLQLTGVVPGQRIVDLGCGDGLLTVTLARHGSSVIGVDIDRTALRAATTRAKHEEVVSARFVEGRIERLPFADGTFNLAVAVTVLCLVPDPHDALREAVRVLRPGGRLVIGELGRWNTWAARRSVKGWLGSDLWRSAHFFSASELSTLSRRAGLRVDRIRGAVYYPPSGALARLLAPLDDQLSRLTTIGAAFIAVAATKPVRPVTDGNGLSTERHDPVGRGAGHAPDDTEPVCRVDGKT